MIWFKLACPCGFSTRIEAIGFVGFNESSTQHEEYRVAWFDQKNQQLESVGYSIPFEVDHDSIDEWVIEQLVPRIIGLNGNCLWKIPDRDPAKTDIACPLCVIECLEMVLDDPPDLRFTVNQNGG